MPLALQEWLDLKFHSWRYRHDADRQAAEKAAAERAAADLAAAVEARQRQLAAADTDAAADVAAEGAEVEGGEDMGSTAVEEAAHGRPDGAEAAAPAYGGAQSMYAKMLRAQKSAASTQCPPESSSAVSGGVKTEAAVPVAPGQEPHEPVRPPARPSELSTAAAAAMEEAAAASSSSKASEASEAEGAETAAQVGGEPAAAAAAPAPAPAPERDWRAEGPRVEAPMSLNSIKAAMPLSEKEVADYGPPSGWVQHVSSSARAEAQRRLPHKWIRLGSAHGRAPTAVGDSDGTRCAPTCP